MKSLVAVALASSFTLSVAQAAPLVRLPDARERAVFAASHMTRSPASLGIAGLVVHREGIHDLGPLGDVAAPVRISLVMRYQHEDELRRLVDDQGQKRSPYYHRYLDNQQWNNYFAPSVGAYERAIDTLQRGGFQIDELAANRGIVIASAPASVVNRFFRTEIHRVFQEHHGIRYANISPAMMPGALRDITVGVAGLSNVEVAEYPHSTRPALRHTQPLARGGLAVTPAAPTPSPTPKPVVSATPGPNPNPAPTLPTGLLFVHGAGGGYGPVAMAVAYDYPVQHGYDGKGRNAGNVISGDFSDKDLAAFMAEFGEKRGTTATTTRINVDGKPGTGAADVGESTLDVEALVGLAPEVNYYEYTIPALGFNNILDAYNRVVSDNIVDAVNSSFGGCENYDPTDEYFQDYLAFQGSAKGITFSASTGDTGSTGCYATPAGNGAPGTQIGIETPSGANYFTAVGGTQLVVDPTSGAYIKENGWQTGGGGVSVFEPLPPWQAATSGVATTGRNIPDVALDAALETGYNTYQGGDALTGGTSLASPLFIAMMIEIDQIQNSRNGWVNPRLYQIVNAAGYGTFFRDVVGGSNPTFTAVPGYDNVTGIGSPLGWALAGTF